VQHSDHGTHMFVHSGQPPRARPAERRAVPSRDVLYCFSGYRDGTPLLVHGTSGAPTCATWQLEGADEFSEARQRERARRTDAVRVLVVSGARSHQPQRW